MKKKHLVSKKKILVSLISCYKIIYIYIYISGFHLGGKTGGGQWNLFANMHTTITLYGASLPQKPLTNFLNESVYIIYFIYLFIFIFIYIYTYIYMIGYITARVLYQIYKNRAQGRGFYKSDIVRVAVI